MAFNSDTYHANRHKRMAWENLAKARAIRSRVNSSNLCEWERPRVSTYARLALSDMRLSVIYRQMAASRRRP